VEAVGAAGAVDAFSVELSRDPLYYNSMTLRTQHDKPVYVRLRETIADAILSGKYKDGDSLPSVRALAAEEQANPLTVAKAYQGFQDEGLIVVKRGVGMFVAAGARARLGESERTRFLKEEWPEIRGRMRRLGIDPQELLERERA
jgi:GntR family transcriptional regulator